MSRPLFLAALGATLTLALAACAGRPTAADYADYEQRLRAKGKLRVETVAADAPVDAATLAVDFERIALNREADSTRPGGDDNLQPTPLRRWQRPLRYRLAGSAVTPADRAEVAGLMTRVARLSGLDIAEADLSEASENFLILVTAPEERDRIEAALGAASPRFARTFAFWRVQPELICIADNLPAPAEPYVIAAAMVVIGDETRGLLRRACLHEEIVQALGLANDHPAVRPSIFNDDGEFALLTRHDELLLRMLYDARLAPGMTDAEAMPLARRIAAELVPAAPPAIAAAMAGGG